MKQKPGKIWAYNREAIIVVNTQKLDPRVMMMKTIQYRDGLDPVHTEKSIRLDSSYGAVKLGP